MDRMPGISAVLFDVDGVLVDSAPAHIFAVRETLKVLGLPSDLTEEEILPCIGHPVQIIGSMFVETPGFSEEFNTHFREKMYNGGGVDLLRPFPEVVTTLFELKKRGFRLAVVTNKRLKGTLIFFERVGIPVSLFDHIASSEAVDRPKPSPESVLHALHAMEVTKTEAVLVGDTEMDIHAARTAGIRCIAVEYGFGKNLEGADLVVGSFNAILSAVAG